MRVRNAAAGEVAAAAAAATYPNFQSEYYFETYSRSSDRQSKKASAEARQFLDWFGNISDRPGNSPLVRLHPADWIDPSSRCVLSPFVFA